MGPVSKRRLLPRIGVPLLLITMGWVLVAYQTTYPSDFIVADFLTTERIGLALMQHVRLVLISSALAVLAAMPLGIVLSRPRFLRYAPAVMAVANVGQTLPSLAVLALFMGFLGLGERTALFALWVYALLPILRNTYTGLRDVEPGVLAAAHGMGMHPARILFRIELPLAFPVIMAGIRTAVVINVGTASLATFIAAGGLGDLIVTGLNLNRWPILITGSVLTALLAILADFVLGEVESSLARHPTGGSAQETPAA